MFIILFGHRHFKRETIDLENECPICGQKNTLKLTVYYKYHHIFFIPTYCYGREYELYCTACDIEIPTEKSDLDRETRDKIKTPIFLFIGLFIILFAGLLIFLGQVLPSLAGKQDTTNEVAFDTNIRENPVQGCVYKLNYGKEDRLIVQIDSLNADSIQFSEYKYSTLYADTLPSRVTEFNTFHCMSRKDFLSYIDTGEVASASYKPYFIDIEESTQRTKIIIGD